MSTLRHNQRPSQPHDAVQGVWVSLGFWGCLMLAVAAYGTATLSTRYAENDALQQRLVEQSTSLKQLSERVRRYDAYCDRLENVDHQQTPNLRMDRAIELEESLQFQLDGTLSATPATAPRNKLAIAARYVSRSPNVRRGLLAMSALLLAVAFVMMVDSASSWREMASAGATLRGPVRRRVGSRYRRSALPPG